MDANDIPDSVHYRLTDSGPPRRSAAMAQATVPFAGPFRPPPGQSDSDPMAAEIHLRLRERKNISEREMLLGSNDSGASLCECTLYVQYPFSTCNFMK